MNNPRRKVAPGTPIFTNLRELPGIDTSLGKSREFATRMSKIRSAPLQASIPNIRLTKTSVACSSRCKDRVGKRLSGFDFSTRELARDSRSGSAWRVRSTGRLRQVPKHGVHRMRVFLGIFAMCLACVLVGCSRKHRRRNRAIPARPRRSPTTTPTPTRPRPTPIS